MKLLLLLNIGLIILIEIWNITVKFYQVYDLKYEATPSTAVFIECNKAAILSDISETWQDCSWKNVASFHVVPLPRVLFLLGLYLPKVLDCHW